MPSTVLLGVFDEKGEILIKGDETRAGFLHWMKIGSLQFDVRKGSAGTTGSKSSVSSDGKVEPGDVFLTKSIDAAAQDLMKNVLHGPAFTARIALIETIGLGYWREFARYELKGAMVSSYQISSATDKEPMVSFTLNHEGGKVELK